VKSGVGCFQLNFYFAPTMANWLQDGGTFLRNGMKGMQGFLTLDA
jgi:hypothetical protein